MKLEDCKYVLLKSFVALGPLGNLLTPQLVTHSFRTYYLCLLFCPIFYFPLQKNQLRALLFFAPFFLYCFVSAAAMQANGLGNQPLFRFFLLLFQWLFILGITYQIKDKTQIKEVVSLYLKSFFVSLTIGYFLYLGFYFHCIPFSFLEHFSVLTQLGYGFLRFSPGSYPNEYGIVSSFVLSILTWMLVDPANTPFSKKYLSTLYVLTLIALLLTTTRTAYLAYAVVLIYIVWRKKQFKLLLKVGGVFLVISLFLTVFGIRIWDILQVGFSTSIFEIGTFEERWIGWSRAWEVFFKHPFLGDGFSAHIDLHNLYFQTLFELGILGCFILLGVFFLFIKDKKFLYLSQIHEYPLVSFVTVSGLIHVFLFGMTNHNLNHHLTWFVVFLCLSLRQLKHSEGFPSLRNERLHS